MSTPTVLISLSCGLVGRSVSTPTVLISLSCGLVGRSVSTVIISLSCGLVGRSVNLVKLRVCRSLGVDADCPNLVKLACRPLGVDANLVKLATSRGDGWRKEKVIYLGLRTVGDITDCPKAEVNSVGTVLISLSWQVSTTKWPLGLSVISLTVLRGR